MYETCDRQLVFHMIYPVERWIDHVELKMKAAEYLAENQEVNDDTANDLTIEEAIYILQDAGLITIEGY